MTESVEGLVVERKFRGSKSSGRRLFNFLNTCAIPNPDNKDYQSAIFQTEEGVTLYLQEEGRYSILRITSLPKSTSCLPVFAQTHFRYIYLKNKAA